jgi:hypothetical protein
MGKAYGMYGGDKRRENLQDLCIDEDKIKMKLTVQGFENGSWKPLGQDKGHGWLL